MKRSYPERFAEARDRFIAEGMAIARVSSEQKELYTVLHNNADYRAEVTGHLQYTAESRQDFPAVGDWVAVQLFDDASPAIIHGILPRKTALVRKAVGKAFTEQVLAANVDIVFIVQSLDENFNPRRLERSIVVVNESGAQPVILLSKTDLITDETVNEKLEEAKHSAPGVPMIAYSALTRTHIDAVRSLIAASATVCFIGSSGVGKSTLINTLAGKEILPTRKVREADSKGRHTTSTRQLIALPEGGFVIDTPGMREIGLWSVSEGSLHDAFPEIREFSSDCRFADCTHVHEPGCSVREAVEHGALSRERYESYLKLRKEAEYVEAKTNIAKQLERKAKEKQLGRTIKEFYKSGKRKYH